MSDWEMFVPLGIFALIFASLLIQLFMERRNSRMWRDSAERRLGMIDDALATAKRWEEAFNSMADTNKRLEKVCHDLMGALDVANAALANSTNALRSSNK